ncbi:MAG: AraC family transcriptional regulator ligand-binding domain-containing protein [Pseudomonadota bacterium]
MPLFEPNIPARYVLPLLVQLGAQDQAGIDAALAALALDATQLRLPQASLCAAQFDALITSLAALSGRGDLGFELGLAIKIADHRHLGEALLRCATLDQLLRLLVRFSRLVTPMFSLQYQRTAHGGELTWRPAAFMSAATLRVMEEIFAVSVHTELHGAFGARLAPFDVHLSMQAPPHARRYARLRPTRFHFGAQALPEVKIEFPSDVLDLPLWPVPLAVTPEQLASLNHQQRDIARRRRWAEWVSLILREAEGCQPTREELAELLNVSPTTLTRQLASEGVTLRALGTQIRHERACALLHDLSQPITQIALRLGYRDGSNFSHAFRKACGMTPQAYRGARCLISNHKS